MVTDESVRVGRPDTLTVEQRTLLASAVKEGYFRVPREVSLADLATAHDLTGREAIARLNRAIEAAVAAAVLDD